MNLAGVFSFSPPKLSALMQAGDTECGVTCLTMLARYYGINTDLSVMRMKYPTGEHGLTVRQLLNIGEDIGLKARALSLGVEQLAKVKMPVILHWNANHFVILAKVSRRGFVIHDPAAGRLLLDLNQVTACFTGIVVELAPQAKIRTQTKSLLSAFLQWISNSPKNL